MEDLKQKTLENVDYSSLQKYLGRYLDIVWVGLFGLLACLILNQHTLFYILAFFIAGSAVIVLGFAKTDIETLFTRGFDDEHTGRP